MTLNPCRRQNLALCGSRSRLRVRTLLSSRCGAQATLANLESRPLRVELLDSGFRPGAGPGMMGWTAPDGIISATLVV
jgi:hypothetical protein